MKSLIIYGSQYGTAKAYATKLSEITEIPCISYENIKDIKDYEQIIYFGGLYAGGVKGLKNTFRLLKNSNIKTILVTVGLADVNNKENTNNIKASLEKQLEKDIYKTFASGMVYIITIILLCSTCITSKQGNLISFIAVTFNIREMIIWTLISILSFTSGLIGFNLYQKSKRTPLLICL